MNDGRYNHETGEFKRKSDLENINKIPAIEAHMENIKETLIEFKEGWKEFQSEIKPHINDVPIIKEKLNTHLQGHYNFLYLTFIPVGICVLGILLLFIFKH